MRRSILKAETGGTVAVIAVLLIALAASGCVGVQSFPSSARAGDTVVLAIGSPDGMTAANTSATYTPNGGTAVPLTIRSIFKLYPDKTSRAWVNSDATNIENQTGHGPWITMVAINLPGTLVEGTGVVSFVTSATYPPSPARDINTAAIPLEILPASAGSGAPNPFNYEIAANLPVAGDLSQLEPKNRLVIKPDFTGLPATTYGAIEIRIAIPTLDVTNPNDVQVIIDEKINLTSAASRVQYMWSIQGSDLVVDFISPIGGLAYHQAYFYLLWPGLKANIDAGIIDVSTLVPVVTYYDVNGNVVAGGDTFTVVDEAT